ncbi:MAG TPA: DNA alkylation repair protein [Clostridiales bacterium]|nr:DNA alkylation repair protein [Clostridiales bacterium]HQK73171.1 DNA alkylation repair protein [Clostridiales bacterium]
MDCREYIEIRQFLDSMSDENYAAFSRKLLPGCEKISGVRLPLLHRLAGEICGKDWRAYLENGLIGDTFEERMLRGFVIAGCQCEWSEKSRLVQSFVKEIDNWSVCDSFCAALKTPKENHAQMLATVRKYILSTREFEARFAAVMLLNYYLDEESFDLSLRLLSSVRQEGYYAVTGVAWALSTAFFIHPEKVSRLLRTGCLCGRTAEKTREKIRQSKHFKPAVHVPLL